MKEYKKNENGLFVCEECGFAGRNYISLGTHITEKHFKPKIYFNKWIKDKYDGICVICGGNTKYLRLSDGYSACCSMKCVHVKRKQTCISKYGCSAPTQNKNVLLKRKNNYFNKHGIYHQMHDEDIKAKIANTNIERYGNKCTLNNIDVSNKRKKTWQKIYGVDHVFSSEIIKSKIKEKNIERYQSENPMQNETLHLKQGMSGKSIHIYENIYYQGSYEKDFLDKYFHLFEIKRGPRIKYQHLTKDKIYYSDFILPKFNIIIEIKNSYHYKRYYDIIMLKRKACLDNGYDFMLIIDKKYNEFESFIESTG